jgi:hypothetical protein
MKNKKILLGMFFFSLSSSLLMGDNLIKNGSFEEFLTLSGNKGWKTTQLIDWDTSDTMRVWTNKKVKAKDGLYKLELDSNKDTVDVISQTIQTQKNEEYTLCLDAYARRNKTSDFQILIDNRVISNIYTTKEWREYCVNFQGNGGSQLLTIEELEIQNDGAGAIIDNLLIEETSQYNYVDNLLKELDTTIYKEKWFNKAKEKWNSEHPENPYIYNYYTYQFPENTDFVAGKPLDKPLLPKEWMQTAGIGFSKFLKYPFDETTRYRYNDEQVREWKSKGFRNGRLHVPLYQMVDLEKDSTGATLKEEDLKKIKDICQIFVDNGVPITVSVVSGGELSDNMKDDREETFRRTIEWWRQLSSYFKDMSYLVAFENYVEYHGFDNVEIEKRDFKVELDNNETHYSGFKNYRRWAITNWVRTPGYNNLMAEIAKVVRVTNPKRIFIYKPNGIGRPGLVNITPWRWGSEADYLGINNKRTPYWLISSGGSANLNFDYIKASRSDNPEEVDTLLASARQGTWGPVLNYYNATKTPVWISLFGIKADLDKVDTQLNGVDVTMKELLDYINWYQNHIQNDAIDENGNRVKLSSGFQQTPWLWDFKNQIWFKGTLNERWDNFERVAETLSKHAQ